MIAKLHCLFLAFCVFTSASATTPAELQTLHKNIDAILKTREHEAQIEIRSYLIPLETKIINAYDQLSANLTESAQAYWNEVAALEKQAASDSKNISSCVALGNNQLYHLNNTFILPPAREIDTCHETALAYLNNCSSKAYDQVMASVELGIAVNACTDDDCADALSIEVLALYSNGTQIIQDAVDDAENYVVIDLDRYLAEITFDSEAYVKGWTSILEDVKNCIGNL